MISPKTQLNLSNAKSYFQKHLQLGQYYSRGSQTTGQWFGAGAAKLGLSGDVRKSDFIALCDNVNPQTGDTLTARKRSEHRRIFYDLTIAPPKSVSLAALIGLDRLVVKAHDEAVAVAMKEFEHYAATRVRVGQSSEDRFTDSLVATTFRHDTSRELDPQLHTHCLLFNATFDPIEKKWKALQNFEILKAQKYIDNAYQHELTRELRKRGYTVEHNNRGSFEIVGIGADLVAKFSKRHRAIAGSLDKLIAERPELARGNQKDMREIIAHAERPDKVELKPTARLAHWENQLIPAEFLQFQNTNENIRTLPLSPARESEFVDLAQSLKWAEDHLFARRSVVEEQELLRFALEKIRGEDFPLQDLKDCLALQPHYLRRDDKNSRKLTTETALATEQEMVAIARDGKWEHGPFHPYYDLDATRLADDQKIAVSHILKSQSFVTLFRGGAGVGKSFALAEVQRALEDAEYKTVTLAPQRQQVIDLEKDGLKNAETVSSFLTRKTMPRESVVLLDEGGQLSAKQMLALFELVEERGGRLICSGDTRQHGAVEASDAMRAIEKYAGLIPVSLNTIRRQDPEKAESARERAFLLEYRKAVEEASEGETVLSFDRLDQLGTIHEIGDEEPANQLAHQYADCLEKGRTVVAVSQTWDEIQRVNEAIRHELKSRSLIAQDEQTVTTLKPIDLTNAQKQEARYYGDDTTIVFNRAHRGFEKGEEVRLLAATNDSLIVQGKDKVGGINFDKLDFISVMRREELALSIGDRIQLKANGKTESGEHLANGEIVTIKALNSTGEITLEDGRVLSQNNRQFIRGYAITSYGSQGKTADHVFLCDSAVRAATSKQQWYVSISRARKGIAIFTRDKHELRKNIYRLGERELALDFLPDEAEKLRPTIQAKRRRNIRRAQAYQWLHNIKPIPAKNRTQSQTPRP
jgi:conjugative relaxase-like TrwC/TraI family protein